jgi:multidrug efflux pump subunit AcrA (membrane-fusion protein)
MKRTTVLILSLVLAACGGRSAELPATEEAPAEADHPDELHVEHELVHEWGIQVLPVELTEISYEVVLSGQMGMNENRTAYITSYVTGKIEALSTDLGMRVSRGDALLTVNSPSFARTQSEFMQARAGLMLAEQEHERARALLAEKAIEEREYNRRQSEYQQRMTEFGAAESVLHSYGIDQSYIESLLSRGSDLWLEEEFHANPDLVIRSPISGTVIFRDVIVGEQVEVEKVLLTVSELGTLWAQLNAYEPDLPFLRVGLTVSIVTALYPDRTFEGRIAYVGDTLDETLRTIPVRVEVPNNDGLLKPNMFVEGRSQVRSEGRPSISVPEDAVQILEGEYVVFVEEQHVHEPAEVVAEEEEDHVVYEVRHVEVGRSIGDLRIIIAGLAEGEHVVVQGAFNLKAEMMKGAFGHTHVH